MKSNCHRYTIILICAFLAACSGHHDDQLPILGNYEVRDGDTIHHEIPEFRFIDQDSQWVTKETFADHIYVADFFFTSCPSICPKVKKQMLRIYDKYQDNPHIKFLSHSIDTRRDTVLRLRQYANNLGVSSDFWHFVTGDKDSLFNIANDYFVSALEDAGAPGGFDHSGRLILVDKHGHIRSFCNGTDPAEVDAFMKDIEKLLSE